MPRFRCVVDLVQHYMRVGKKNVAGTVWVDREGCPHSPVLLKSPLRKSPPSLLHAARLAVHKALDSNPLTPKLWSAPKHRLLPLPPTLIDYLGEYPYSIQHSNYFSLIFIQPNRVPTPSEDIAVIPYRYHFPIEQAGDIRVRGVTIDQHRLLIRAGSFYNYRQNIIYNN